MKCYHLPSRVGLCLMILLALSLPVAVVYTQDLPGVLRNLPRRPNPSTATKPRATPRPAPPPSVSRSPAPARPKPAPPARPRVSVEDKIEGQLDAANDDRDLGRFDRAEKRYTAILKARPREWRAAYGLGNVYSDQQLWEKAEKFYGKAGELNPKNAEIPIALGYILLQPRASGNDATLLLKAEQSARRALTLEPGNATANDLLGLALEQRGIISQEAENAFRAAISQDPNLAVPYVHLGRFLHRKALLAETPLAARGLITEEANGLYRKAISLAGQQDADTAILVASELQWEQRWEDSLPLLEYALSKDKDNPSALLLEGNAYNATRRFEEAVKVLDVARKKVPGTFRPHYMIGTSYLRLGRIGEAEDAFNEAARFATQKEKEVLSGNFGYGGLGDAYVGSGRYKDAVRAYERAIICNPENKDLQNKAEDARRKAGK